MLAGCRRQLVAERIDHAWQVGALAARGLPSRAREAEQLVDDGADAIEAPADDPHRVLRLGVAGHLAREVLNSDRDRTERTDDVVRDASRELVQLVRPLPVALARLFREAVMTPDEQRRKEAADGRKPGPDEVERWHRGGEGSVGRLAQLGGAMLDPERRDGEGGHRDGEDQEGSRQPEVSPSHRG